MTGPAPYRLHAAPDGTAAVLVLARPGRAWWSEPTPSAETLTGVA